MKLNKKQVKILFLIGIALLLVLNSQTQSLEVMGAEGSFDLWTWLTTSTLIPGFQNWMILALGFALLLLVRS